MSSFALPKSLTSAYWTGQTNGSDKSKDAAKTAVTTALKAIETQSKLVDPSLVDVSKLTAAADMAKRGDELDVRCDVYAAGIMLYELLSGAPPFTAETPLGVLTAHLTADVIPPSQKPGGKDRVTPALEAVTLHALERDPNRRYPSATALAEAIRSARLKPTAGEAFAATVPSRPPPSTTDVDPTAPTLLGESVIPREALPSRPAPIARMSSRPPPEPKSSKTMWVALWIAVIVLSIGAGALLALKH